MPEIDEDALATARARLTQANGGRLSEEELERLAPGLAELTAGLAALERQLAPESEPATIQRVEGAV